MRKKKKQNCRGRESSVNHTQNRCSDISDIIYKDSKDVSKFAEREDVTHGDHMFSNLLFNIAAYFSWIKYQFILFFT